VVVGAIWGDVLEASYRTPSVVSVTLVVGALGLVVAERLGRQKRTAESLGYGEALAIGVAQAAALVPGLSRSGGTMTVAMLLGLSRAAAARFVFLMSLPAVLAVALKEGYEVSRVGLGGLPVSSLLVGFVVSGVVGYLTVKFFLRYLAGHSLTVFAVYRVALAAVWWLGQAMG
jgi:undecaprenyl-diphosphatase